MRVKWECPLCGFTAELQPQHFPLMCACGKRYESIGDSAPAMYCLGGPGTELRKLFLRLGISAGGKCGCESRAALMDQWGSDECSRRREEIADWLVESSNDLAVIKWLPEWSKRTAALWLVDEAIKRSRDK